jgi:TetR/AcrR family transcriptional regulator, transcriptional repressor for nem operon
MPRTSDKREDLILAADSLFHRKGFERSTIADVAAAAAVPMGNVYYYFKTKEELVAAVTQARNEAAALWFQELDRLATAKARLLRFVARFDTLVESRQAHGCPTGGLCLETNKIGGPIAEQAAIAFRRSLAWLARQFGELGRKPKQAREDAARIVGGIQGAILLTNTFKEPEFMLNETRRLKEWLDALPDSIGAKRLPSAGTKMKGKKK